MTMDCEFVTLRRRIGSLICGVAVCFVAPAAMAQAVVIPEASQGHVLAERLCKGCHLVEGASSASVPAGLPSLRGIANKAGQTGQHIMDMLIQPSHPMPDMQLSSEEILHLVSYLETLRTNPGVPPLIVPAKPVEKPARPFPS